MFAFKKNKSLNRWGGSTMHDKPATRVRFPSTANISSDISAGTWPPSPLKTHEPVRWSMVKLHAWPRRCREAFKQQWIDKGLTAQHGVSRVSEPVGYCLPDRAASHDHSTTENHATFHSSLHCSIQKCCFSHTQPLRMHATHVCTPPRAHGLKKLSRRIHVALTTLCNAVVLLFVPIGFEKYNPPRPIAINSHEFFFLSTNATCPTFTATEGDGAMNSARVQGRGGWVDRYVEELRETATVQEGLQSSSG